MNSLNELSIGDLRVSKSNGKIMGVCSGLANWLDVDVTIVRFAVVAGSLFIHPLPIVYLIMGLVLPNEYGITELD